VTVIQRFGSGLQLNIHFHTLVLDGVFSDARPGGFAFHPTPPPSDEDVAQVLATVCARVGRLLARRQLEPADDTAPANPLAEASPVLAGLASASVQGRIALGRHKPFPPWYRKWQRRWTRSYSASEIRWTREHLYRREIPRKQRPEQFTPSPANAAGDV
jgi:Putative transposase